MPDENDGHDPAGDTNGDPLPPPPVEPTIEQRIVALECKSRAQKQDEGSSKLLGDVKTAERWLIGLNGLLLITNIVIAWIYMGQLNQMKVATQASASAAETAAESLQTNTLQVDRSMVQTVDQTVAQVQSAEATIKAANAARDAVNQAKEFSQLDERPWISLQGITCSECSGVLGPISLHISQTQTLTIQQGLVGSLVNSGKTPALRTNIEFFSFSQEVNLARQIIPSWESVVTDWDARERVSLGGLPPDVQKEARAYIGSSMLGPYARTVIAPMSLAPQAPFGFYLMHEQKLTREYITPLKKAVFIIGKIAYYDSTASTKSAPPYVTTFCIENLSYTPDGFTQCPSGNDMK